MGNAAALADAIVARDEVSAVPSERARAIVRDGLVVARALASAVEGDGQLSLARAMTFLAVSSYWDAAEAGGPEPWPVLELPTNIALVPLHNRVAALARRMGTHAAELDVTEASYLIGVLYTALMPGRVRSDLGAYYTPPKLCERLLDMAEDAGIDWRTARIIDPACGGGAFLSPVARRMAESLLGRSAKIALHNISQRLRGFELDPFAAWMSQVFLEVTLRKICRSADVRLPVVVHRPPCQRGQNADGIDGF
jgi:adenine-specific DNA-methyltransferase